MRTGSIELPWPPTVNTYWRHVNGRTLLSAKGRQYRLEVGYLVPKMEPLTHDLDCEIFAHPPDRRKRDVDNLPKAILDGLQHAGVIADDAQIKRL